MAKKQIDLGLTGLDELFMDDRERAESKLPKIHEIPLSEIDEFPNHPFHVRIDEDMDQLVESVKERGIITPVTLRQKPDGRYEIVSGHRRTKACELAGLTTVKAEIKELSRDEAIILMVEADPVEDAPEDAIEDDRLAAYASTVTKRTSGDYYDTLIDDCHVFSFGLDLTKLFSDVDAETAAETKLYDSVKFKIQNKTNGTWIIAKRNDEEGVYYVTGHTDKEADATVFTPVTMAKSYGHIMVKGLEEDTYTITETQTANGYTLLKNAINVTITVKENTSNTCNVYAKDVLGVLQNDPHYSFDGGEDLKLANIPQRALSHNYPTASATVDKNEVTMLEDNGSANAEVPLTVKNTKGFDLPKTGDHGTWMYSLVGILMMSAAAGVIVLTTRKKNGR